MRIQISSAATLFPAYDACLRIIEYASGNSKSQSLSRRGLEYADCISQRWGQTLEKYLGYDTKLYLKFQLDLETVKYPFIAITPRSTLVLSDSTS